MVKVRKQPVEKSHELLARSEFLGSAIGSRHGVISIGKKCHGRREKTEGKQAGKRMETSRGVARGASGGGGRGGG